MPRKLAAGNWKMNGLRTALAEVEALAARIGTPGAEVLLCPPATLVRATAKVCAANPITIGGQDCHADPAGAHTGDISAAMLADAGAEYVILGHSERRAAYAETDSSVHAKAAAAWSAGLQAIICLGETLAEREAGRTLDIVGGQLAACLPDGATPEGTVVAYEPVWAIGTGLTPTRAQIAEVHDFLRARLIARFGRRADEFRLLYGGSVSPSNAAEIFSIANVDGGLVGGASLKALDFAAIIAALDAA